MNAGLWLLLGFVVLVLIHAWITSGIAWCPHNMEEKNCANCTDYSTPDKDDIH